MSIFATLPLLAIHAADPTISDICQPGFRDAYLIARVDKADQKELTKIKKNFGTQYRVKQTKFWVKEPHRIRMEANVEDTTVLYIEVGPTKFFRIPRINVVQKVDVKDEPGKRQSLMDFGILTSSLFQDPFAAKFVRIDRATNDYVFDITYKNPPYTDKSRHRVWVDPQKRYTTKREWYAQSGKQLATFFYDDPIQENGAWIATKLTVKNIEGKVAAVISYVDVQLNKGIDESMFKFK